MKSSGGFNYFIFFLICTLSILFIYWQFEDKLFKETPNEILNKKPPKTVRKPPKKSDEKQKNFVYSWMDEEGVKHFTDSPPPEHVTDYATTTAIRSNKTTFYPQKELSPFPPNEMETNVIIKGNAVMVPVKLGYRGKEVCTWLTFDTGAETTVIHKAVADELKILSTHPGKSIIADGTIIDTRRTHLDYIIVGPFMMKNLQTSIVDYKTQPGIDKGLLGMNFLKNVSYKIDFNGKSIKWSTQ